MHNLVTPNGENIVLVPASSLGKHPPLTVKVTHSDLKGKPLCTWHIMCKGDGTEYELRLPENNFHNHADMVAEPSLHQGVLQTVAEWYGREWDINPSYPLPKWTLENN